MIQSQLALLRRELWEHRSIYVTPVVIALLVSLMSLTVQVSICPRTRGPAPCPES